MRALSITGAALVGSCSILAMGCKRDEREVGAVPPVVSALAKLGEQRLDYEKPVLDLPAERLSERVDGGERKLRSLGCRRLRVWRIERSPAELELLTFNHEQGAAKFLSDLAGTERSPNLPGDEGWVGSNVLYFRRGAMLARVIADQPESAELLRASARDLEQAITQGKITP